MKVSLFSLLVCFEIICKVVTNEDTRNLHPPVVETIYGPVRGVFLPEGMQAYLGIPYVKPPLDELRWQPPAEPTPWSPDVFDAFHLSPGCPQECTDINIMCPSTTDEDCLYLNIWAPRDTKPSSNLPVYLFIHGGSFHTWSASSSTYDGRFIAEENHMIVVSFNYRIGALGWLYTGEDDGLTGNYGLMDQRAAFRFVRDNIKNFGGNPNKVTLGGQSAGAQSIVFHMTNPDTEDYFHQAILESTPIGVPAANITEAVKLATLFSSSLKCSTSDPLCLRSKTADEVVQAQLQSSASPINIRNPLLLFEQWGPVIDGVMIKKHPLDEVAAGNVQAIPVIIGETFTELISYIYYLFPTPPSQIEILAIFTAYFGRYTIPLLQEYWEYWTPDILPLMGESAADYIFVCPSRLIARSIDSGFHHSDAPVYRYIFNHTFRDIDVWKWSDSQGSHVNCMPPSGNTCHDAELFFTWYPALTLTGIKFSKLEQRLARNIQSYWANFIHTGDPNNVQWTLKSNGSGAKSPRISSKLEEWSPYSETTGWKSLFIEQPRAKSYRQDFKKDKCDLFDKIGYFRPVGPLAPSAKKCSTPGVQQTIETNND